MDCNSGKAMTFDVVKPVWASAKHRPDSCRSTDPRPPLRAVHCLPVQVEKFVDTTRLLQSSLAKYFDKRLFSDITVIAPDGRKLLCHQVVLSAGSKRFANMLEQGKSQTLP